MSIKKCFLLLFYPEGVILFPMFKWQMISFETVESTNDTARDYPCGTAVVARCQTQGRGRHGRTWQSLNGNLFLSVVLPEMGEKTPLLAFVVGLAVVEALPEVPLKLKWPNDVLKNGAKVAGILLERTDDKVIAGIGVNLKQAPQQHLLYRTDTLGTGLSPQALAERILKSLNTMLTRFQENGTAWLLACWLKKAAGVGQLITVKMPTETITGIFNTLSPEGALLLTLDNGTQKAVSAGDIFL